MGATVKRGKADLNMVYLSYSMAKIKLAGMSIF